MSVVHAESVRFYDDFTMILGPHTIRLFKASSDSRKYLRISENQDTDILTFQLFHVVLTTS